MISQYILFLAICGMSLADMGLIGHGQEHHAPKPYKFGYSIKDNHGEQHREESGNGGQAVQGSYGFTDARGIHRQVNYVADHGGFRAQVKTNEPGTANQNPAAVHLVSSAPHTGNEGYLGVPAAVAGYGGLGGAYGGLGGAYGGLGGAYGGLGGAYGVLGGAYGGLGGAYGGLGGAYGGIGGAYGGLGGAYGGYGGNGLGILGGLGYERYGY